MGVLYEAELMQQLGSSKCILGVFGFTYVDGSPAIVVEYCENRDLLSFLRTNLAKHKEIVGKVSVFI